MPIVNRVAEFHSEITSWRHDFHTQPELLYEVHQTAARVADTLRSIGCDEVVTGIGRTGVVGVINGRRPGGSSSSKVIGLRADMDALPIEEANNLPYKSKVPGKMHACGHDGHMAMLLGAAKYLAETRNFDGTAIVIFQPAEEGGAGAKAMIDDGLLDRFGIQEVYGMHNFPGLAVGEFSIRPGPIMAAADHLVIEIEGKGSHAGRPHLAIDTVLVGAQIVNQVQSVVSRNVDPLESAVVSITVFQAGETNNVIPQKAVLKGTVRTFKPDVQDLIERRLHEIVEGTAKLYGARATLTYKRGYPVTSNHDEQTEFSASVAREIADGARVDVNMAPLMVAEDFSYMLQARPGAFIFIGNGDSAGLHEPNYNFNDDAIPFGASYWIKLTEKALGA